MIQEWTTQEQKSLLIEAVNIRTELNKILLVKFFPFDPGWSWFVDDQEIFFQITFPLIGNSWINRRKLPHFIMSDKEFEKFY